MVGETQDMNLQEASAFRRGIKRKAWGQYIHMRYADNDSSYYVNAGNGDHKPHPFTFEDFQAKDWEIEELGITIKRSEYWKKCNKLLDQFTVGGKGAAKVGFVRLADELFENLDEQHERSLEVY